MIWHEIELSEKDYKNLFEEYINFMDEPVCDVAAIAQWAIYKMVKKLGFKVALSGNGGDELFYGYPSHNKTGEIIELLGKLANLSFRKRTQFLLKNPMKAIDILKYYNSNPFGRFAFSSYSSLKYKWHDEFDFSNIDVYKNYYNDEKTGIEKIYSYLFNVWLPNNCYYLADKLGMGNSLELRAPFADRKLIDFVSSLPLKYKYHKKNPKGFLKDILKGIVPEYILKAKKKGFTPPENVINSIIKNYKSKFFKTRLSAYNQVLIDKFLDIKIKK